MGTIEIKKVERKVTVGKKGEQRQQVKKTYGKIIYRGTMRLTDMAEHIMKHGSIYTEDVVIGVITKLKSCMQEHLGTGERLAKSITSGILQLRISGLSNCLCTASILLFARSFTHLLQYMKTQSSVRSCSSQISSTLARRSNFSLRLILTCTSFLAEGYTLGGYSGTLHAEGSLTLEPVSSDFLVVIHNFNCKVIDWAYALISIV